MDYKCASSIVFCLAVRGLDPGGFWWQAEKSSLARQLTTIYNAVQKEEIRHNRSVFEDLTFLFICRRVSLSISIIVTKDFVSVINWNRDKAGFINSGVGKKLYLINIYRIFKELFLSCRVSKTMFHLIFDILGTVTLSSWISQKNHIQ